MHIICVSHYKPVSPQWSLLLSQIVKNSQHRTERIFIVQALTCNIEHCNKKHIF